MKLTDYVIRRLILLIPVLIGISFITFILTHNIPGYDPAAPWMKERTTMAERALIVKQHHLDEPTIIQYFYYMSDLSHLDMGFSSSQGNKPVSEMLALFFPATIELTIFSLFICIVIGIPIGIISAIRRDRWPDHIVRIFSLTGISIPVFWFALILQYIFYLKLDLLPLGGRLNIGVDPPVFNIPFIDIHSTGLFVLDSILAGNWTTLSQALVHLVLPSFCLAFVYLAVIARMTRSSMLESMSQDYIRTARSKGLSEGAVVFKHALKNALIPTTTVVGLMFGALLSGAVLTETIFFWPGIGRYSTYAISSLDYASIMGFTLLVAIIYVFSNLFVDILYAYLDPRIKYG